MLFNHIALPIIKTFDGMAERERGGVGCSVRRRDVGEPCAGPACWVVFKCLIVLDQLVGLCLNV
jgi:hypothetical protein